jgi:MFS transporter, DHA2 family, multidrug resistance protein
VLGLGLFVTGAGIALLYASAPRLGLSALSHSQAGQGSGMLNSCSFLGGTIGVTCGGIAFMRQGIGAVLAVVAIPALLGAALCLFLRGAAVAKRPMDG